MALLDEYNKDVSGWARGTKRKLKLKVIQLTTEYSGHSRTDLNTDVKKYRGEAAKINFAFPYYMVFVHKGAGKGAGGSKTGKYTKKDGSKGITNPNSMGKMGIKRRPKAWFNPVIEERFPELAELVGAYHAGKVVLAINKIMVR